MPEVAGDDLATATLEVMILGREPSVANQFHTRASVGGLIVTRSLPFGDRTALGSTATLFEAISGRNHRGRVDTAVPSEVGLVPAAMLMHHNGARG